MVRFTVVLHREDGHEDRFEHVGALPSRGDMLDVHRGYQWSQYEVKDVIHTISPFADENKLPIVHALFRHHLAQPKEG